MKFPGNVKFDGRLGGTNVALMAMKVISLCVTCVAGYAFTIAEVTTP